MKTLEPVVILGAGFAGLSAARGLRNYPGSVTVIDKSNHHLFQPLLYQVATASLSPAQIASPIRSILKNQTNTHVLLAEVTAIDRKHKNVILETGEKVPYGKLIVATGSRVSYFAHDEWKEFAPGLKTIPDATQIRRQVLLAFEKAERETDPKKQKELLHFVLVGGGPTGVEMAGALAELAKKALARDFRKIHPSSAKITLIEAGNRILEAFPEDLALKATKVLEDLGVEIRTSCKVEKIDAEGASVAGELIKTKNILWTAGVKASPAASWLGIEADRGGRIAVNAHLQLADDPNIYVLGDLARVTTHDGKTLPGLAPVAMQEGRYVAKVLLKGKLSEPFQYKNKGNLATIGRSNAIAELGPLRFWGWPGWVLWVVVHIYYLIGFRNRLMVMIEWAWAYLTFQRGARLIIPKSV